MFVLQDPFEEQSTKASHEIYAFKLFDSIFCYATNYLLPALSLGAEFVICNYKAKFDKEDVVNLIEFESSLDYMLLMMLEMIGDI